MSDANPAQRSYAHLIYALVSVACPFIALALISIYQEYSYEWYWQLTEKPGPLDDAEKNAGALMGFVMFIQLLMAVMVGCTIGLVFAALSIWKRRRFVSFGTAAFAFNSIPIVLLFWRLLAGPL